MKSGRVAAFLLCIVLVFASVACSSEQSSSKTTDARSSSDVTETETEIDNLAKFRGLNLGGFSFDVLSYDQQYWETYAAPEGETGEVLNDAAYRRNVEIEEMLNIKIALLRKGDYEDVFKKQVQAGDSGQCDLVIFWPGGNKSPYIINNLVYDWRKVPSVDLGAEWYNQTSNNAYSIAGKQYFAVSDYTFPVQQHFRILFNKQMAEDFHIPSPYDTAFAGNWTLDYMLSLCKNTYSDLDGDGEKSFGDRYGFALNYATSSAIPLCSGEMHVISEKDGIRLNLFSERIVSIVEKIVSLRSNPDIYVHSYGNEHYDIFFNGNALFMPYSSDPLLLRDIEFDYGYLMYPKFDETQKNYVVWSLGGLMAIPVNTPDIDSIGTVIEALSIASNKYVKDAFIEMYIIGKVLRDEESEKVYRMMRDLATYDLALDVDPSNMLNTYKYYSYFMEKGSADVASYYAKISKAVTAAYDELYEAAVSNN